MNGKNLLLTGLLVVGMCWPGLVGAAMDTSDNWDDGQLHGWMGNTAWTEVVGEAAGGNPSGYLRSRNSVADNPSRTIGALNREGRYTGDFAAAGVYRVSVDLNLLSGQMNWVLLRLRYHDATFNGWTYRLDTSLPVGQWRHYEVSFDPNWTDAQAIAAGWQQESSTPSFQQTLSDVYTTEIRLLYPPSNTTAPPQLGIDNFHLYAAGGGEARAVPVLGPPLLAALVLALVFMGYRRLRKA